MKKKVVCLLMTAILAVSFICSLCVSASAASAISTFNADNTVTFTVKTGAKSPSIKFTSTAETVSWKVPIFRITKSHTCAHAPKLVIKVSPAIDGKSYFFVQDFFMTKNISSTLKMKANTTYTITVTKLLNKDNYCSVKTDQVGAVHVNENIPGHPYTGYCNGTWKMSNINNCTVSNVRVK